MITIGVSRRTAVILWSFDEGVATNRVSPSPCALTKILWPVQWRMESCGFPFAPCCGAVSPPKPLINEETHTLISYFVILYSNGLFWSCSKVVFGCFYMCVFRFSGLPPGDFVALLSVNNQWKSTVWFLCRFMGKNVGQFLTLPVLFDDPWGHKQQ